MFYVIRIAPNGDKSTVTKRHPKTGEITEASWYIRQPAEAAARAMKVAEHANTFVVEERY